MKCENCKKMKAINGFTGYQHFSSTKAVLDSHVKNDFFEMVQKNSYEVIYRCKKCNTVWALATPDFPVCGYLEQR